MTVLHKKQIVLGALILMVGVAGYLNWKYDSNAEVTNNVDVAVSEEKNAENLGEATMVSNTNKDYFSTCRSNREIVRSKAIEILKSTIDNPNTSQENKDKAQNEIISISNNIEAEGNIENLIRAKGFEEAVVFINDNNITATVKTQGLTSPETAKIKDIIIQETGNNNIKIVEVK